MATATATDATAADATAPARKSAPRPTFATLGRRYVKGYTERVILDGGTVTVRLTHRPDTGTVEGFVKTAEKEGMRFVKQHTDAIIGNDGKGGKEGSEEIAGAAAAEFLAQLINMRNG